MNTKRLRGLLLVLVLLCMVGAATAPYGGAVNDDENVIYVLRIDGTITEGTALDVIDGLQEAEELDAEAVLIELDTPGGLVSSTLKITEAILNVDVPVITYVAPKGAIAASAGSFILISGNIAAMAPGTTTGAAMPVEIGLEGRQAADNKTINFFAGHVESIAASRGRNATQAKRFVTENDVLNENLALERGIIDLIAEDETELLTKVDGMTVRIGTENRTLATRDASLSIKEKTIRSSLLEILSNPQIAVILLLVGIYGLIFGFLSPGTYVPEMIGAISLILALYGLGFLEGVNEFGVILIIAAVILFIAEALTPTFGILTTGGAICLVIGAIILPKEPFLFNPESGLFEGFVLSIIGVAVAFAIFFFFAIGAVLKSRKRRAQVGGEELIGKVSRAETEINEDGGTLKLRGEIWNARTAAGEHIAKGEKVEIVDRDGLTLIVKRKERDN